MMSKEANVSHEKIRERSNYRTKEYFRLTQGNRDKAWNSKGNKRLDRGNRVRNTLEKRWSKYGSQVRLCDIKLSEWGGGIRRVVQKGDAPSLIEPPPSTCHEHMCWWQHSDWKPDGLLSLLRLLPYHRHPSVFLLRLGSLFSCSFSPVSIPVPSPVSIPCIFFFVGTWNTTLFRKVSLDIAWTSKAARPWLTVLHVGCRTPRSNWNEAFEIKGWKEADKLGPFRGSIAGDSI